MLGHSLHFNEYTTFQKQCLDIRYLNLAQISGCKAICTIIMDSRVDPSSCSPGNATLAFLYSYVQINHASRSVWDLHCHCAVWICLSLIPLRVQTDTHTHCYWAKPIKGVACETDWPTVFSWIYFPDTPLAQFCRNAAHSFVTIMSCAVDFNSLPSSILSEPQLSCAMCPNGSFSNKLAVAVQWPRWCGHGDDDLNLDVTKELYTQF